MPNKPNKPNKLRKLNLEEIYNRMEEEIMDSLIKIARQEPKPHAGQAQKTDASKGK